ncbi:hypothetical protein JMJ77_0001978, partial [Colletotrichum scovillei]
RERWCSSNLRRRPDRTRPGRCLRRRCGADRRSWSDGRCPEMAAS